MNAFKRFMPILGAVAACLSYAGGAHASLITNGFTFSVASSGDLDTGTHYHSNTGGAFGNPAGKAEVGRFSSEEVRGLSEYDITGLTTVTSAFVTFDVFMRGGLFSGTNGAPFTGTIQVDAYAGNNAEDISDYQATSLGAVGSFFVNAAGGPAVGDIFSFDITSLLNTAISANATSFGIRLEENRGNADFASSKAWTFDSFRLTTDNLSTNVPEPATLTLVGIALFGLASSARRRLH